VASRARSRVRPPHDSVPVPLVGQRVEVRVHAQPLEVFHAGAVVATPERLHRDISGSSGCWTPL
jgi:hypothetical protein